MSRLCSDIQSGPRKIKAHNGDWKISTPLLVPTPNFRSGLGAGDDSAEKYIPNPSCLSPDELARYEFIGCLMGAACRFAGFCELDLPSLIWKAMLGEKSGIRELHAIDAETASHLESVAAIDDESLWNAQTEVDPVRWSVRLINHHVVLRGNHGTEVVSFEERAEYVAEAEAAWLAQFQPQIDSMRKGFDATFPQLAARLLTWRELERRVCGVADVSVKALQRIAKYEGSYTKGSDCECNRIVQSSQLHQSTVVSRVSLF
eukprot:COSAG05_NODE_4076_length_1685_cov_1.047919_1_plen_260_part_00